MVSVPYGVMPYSAPAASTASQTARPYQLGTLSSYASSPEKLIRATRAGTPPTSASRQVMNGNAALSTSSAGATAPTTARDSGPTTATVAQCSVTDVQCTRRSGHSVWSHSSSHSSTAAALPVVVVMTNRSSAIRMATPSSNTIPSTRHISPYRQLPTLRLLIRFV